MGGRVLVGHDLLLTKPQETTPLCKTAYSEIRLQTATKCNSTIKNENFLEISHPPIFYTRVSTNEKLILEETGENCIPGILVAPPMYTELNAEL